MSKGDVVFIQYIDNANYGGTRPPCCHSDCLDEYFLL